jgi:hypothetical protein
MLVMNFSTLCLHSNNIVTCQTNFLTFCINKKLFGCNETEFKKSATTMIPKDSYKEQFIQKIKEFFGYCLHRPWTKHVRVVGVVL